jgi:ABC-type Mn2+/Zn2+ transport system permease subunit
VNAQQQGKVRSNNVVWEWSVQVLGALILALPVHVAALIALAPSTPEDVTPAYHLTTYAIGLAVAGLVLYSFRRFRVPASSVIGMVLSTAFSLGILFVFLGQYLFSLSVLPL